MTSEWIDVRDNHPDEDQEVEVIIHTLEIDMKEIKRAIYKNNTYYVQYNDNEFSNGPPLKWRPSTERFKTVLILRNTNEVQSMREDS